MMGVGHVVMMRFELPRIEYVQGESVTGRLHVEPRQDLSPRAVRVSLQRREVVPGGDRTNVEELVEAQHDYPAQLSAGRPASFDFTLAVPSKWCPSYQSANAHVEWRVAAALDLAWKRDIHAWQGLRVYNGASRFGQSPQETHVAQSPSPSPFESPSSVEMPAPNFCRNCGGALAPGALFCGNCGAQVAGSRQ